MAPLFCKHKDRWGDRLSICKEFSINPNFIIFHQFPLMLHWKLFTMSSPRIYYLPDQPSGFGLSKTTAINLTCVQASWNTTCKMLCYDSPLCVLTYNFLLLVTATWTLWEILTCKKHFLQGPLVAFNEATMASSRVQLTVHNNNFIYFRNITTAILPKLGSSHCIIMGWSINGLGWSGWQQIWYSRYCAGQPQGSGKPQNKSTVFCCTILTYLH
jgi:hypothetical protein